MEETKKTSFHQCSWNYAVETTWNSLIGWHHKTSIMYVCTTIYSKIELNSIACAKISTKTSNTRLCAYRCVQGWRKHFKLGGDIHKKHIFNIYMLLYCAFGGHLKALHLLAILGGIFWQIWWWGRHPHCPHPFRRPWVYVASYVQWCDVDSGPLWITQWIVCTKIISFNL